jgi:uncharacterized protein (DUF2384 family)
MDPFDQGVCGENKDFMRTAIPDGRVVTDCNRVSAGPSEIQKRFQGMKKAVFRRRKMIERHDLK